MASTYGNDLRLEEIGDGEQSGTWGATTNTNLELIAEALSFGTEVITTNANTHDTIIADGATDPGRSLYLKYTGTLDSTCTITIGPNSISKTWYIENGTSGSQSIIISQGSGANVTIPTGQTKIVYSDGAGSGAAMGEIGTLGVTNINVSTAATVGTLDTSGAVNLNLVTDSTSSTSGALIVDGGVGIAKKLFVGTDLDVGGTTNLDAVDIDGAVQLDATFTVGANDQGYDVTLHGDTAARNVVWDSSADSLIFSDNAKAVFGAGPDLEIYHDGTNSLIDDTDSGFIAIRSDTSVKLLKRTGNEDMLVAVPDGAVTLYHDNAAKIATTSTGVEVTGAATVGGAAVKVAGKESIWIPAAAMYPSTTNGCSALTQVETTALRPDLNVLDFAAAADDFAQFAIAFPKSWNEGTITYQPFWTVTGTNTGTVVWQLGGVAITSDESLNTAFGTLVATTALAHSGTSNDLMVSAESGAVTIAGSPAANDQCFFQINNDASASGQTGAARLLGIKLFFTTDAANDA